MHSENMVKIQLSAPVVTPFTDNPGLQVKMPAIIWFPHQVILRQHPPCGTGPAGKYVPFHRGQSGVRVSVVGRDCEEKAESELLIGGSC